MTEREFLERSIRRIQVISRDEDAKRKTPILFIEGLTMEQYVAVLNRILEALQKVEVDPKVAKVSKRISSYYEKAVHDPEIRKPMAWALYKAWQAVDLKEKERTI